MTEERKISLFDLMGKRVYVAGHKGMVGSALVRRLKSERCHILTTDRAALDLNRQTDTERWIDKAKPDAVILAAARVGGIAFNDSHPVDFLSDNLARRWRENLTSSAIRQLGRPFGGLATSSSALIRFDRAAKEWIGLVAHRIMGKTDALFPEPHRGSEFAC